MEVRVIRISELREANEIIYTRIQNCPKWLKFHFEMPKWNEFLFSDSNILHFLADGFGATDNLQNH